jgi:hypothetical protein
METSTLSIKHILIYVFISAIIALAPIAIESDLFSDDIFSRRELTDVLSTQNQMVSSLK